MVAVMVALLFFQATDYYEQGAKAVEDGKYAEAIPLLQKAIETDPKDYNAHFNLALAYSFQHKDAEGVAEYRKTLELKPGLYEAELNGAILLLRLKDPESAIPWLEDAVQQKPAAQAPRLMLAEAQLQTGVLEKAEASFRAVLEADPKSAPAESGLAHALARQNKLADAEPHFRQAALLDPAYRPGLLELASLYEQNHQDAGAITLYREFPDNPAAQQHLGVLMLENRRYADALPSLEAAYAKDHTLPNRSALAAAYVFTGQLDKALPLLSAGVEEDPSDYDQRMMYGRALRDRKQYPAAAAQFAAAAKLKPSDPKAYSELGNMFYMQGDLPQALAAYDRARDAGENTPGNWFLRAIILDKLKQMKPALEAYRQFLSMSQGAHPDQEFQARQRARILQREVEKR